ncbi:MAG: hypothetical protein ACI9C1_003823 [Candidatus Aldehydirespiratoraceae bacterium]
MEQFLVRRDAALDDVVEVVVPSEPVGIGENCGDVGATIEKALAVRRIPEAVVAPVEPGPAEREDQLEELLMVLDRIQHASPTRESAPGVHAHDSG